MKVIIFSVEYNTKDIWVFWKLFNRFTSRQGLWSLITEFFSTILILSWKLKEKSFSTTKYTYLENFSEPSAQPPIAANVLVDGLLLRRALKFLNPFCVTSIHLSRTLIVPSLLRPMNE